MNSSKPVDQATNTQFAIPKHAISDYILLILLSICIGIGAPMTIAIQMRLVRRLRLGKGCMWAPWSQEAQPNTIECNDNQNRNGQHRYAHTTTSPRSAAGRRADWLKLQLSVADLMVLIFYAFSKVVWTLTYDWRGGEMLCKLVRFSGVLSFHMCSNSVVCIGLDRVITLFRPFSYRSGRRTRSAGYVGLWRKAHLSRAGVMITISTVMAFLCSLPQLWLWTVTGPTSEWQQCVSSCRPDNPKAQHDSYWAVYNYVHLLTIFWIPLAIVLACYVIIVTHVILHLHEPVSGPSQPLKPQVMQELRGTRFPRAFSKRMEMRCCMVRALATRGRLHFGRLTRQLCRQSLTVLTVYIVCWLPYNAFTLWGSYSPEGQEKYRTTLRFLQELIVVNSVVNPFLYACDVYHQIVDERSRNEESGCLCCLIVCPCALDDHESEVASQEFL